VRVGSLLLLVACGGDPEPADPSTGVTPDPRFDRDTWPAFVGGDRPAAVVAPAGWDGESLLPVVVLLHGYSANAALQDLYFGLSDRVDERGFLLVLPEGTTDGYGLQFWNATPACCDFGATGVDDVAYLSGLLDEVEAAFPVDPARVAFVGHSNGSFMAYRMACEIPERIAAIAGLAGSTWADEVDCTGADAVAVLHVHGDVDDTILYEGTSFYPGAEETIARWADKAGCADPTDGAALDYDEVVAGAETTPHDYAGCERPIALWTMAGSGHIPLVNDAFREALIGWTLTVGAP
jgi:polyhydroxybutyrate depolymerase